jgi:hypothetical protein
MKEIILSTVILFGLSVEAVAEDWKWMPIAGEEYTPDYAVASLWGSHELDKYDNYSGDVFGVELSMKCGLLQASEHEIRQQISLTNYDHHKDRVIILGLNPHYMFSFADQFYLGFGPSMQLVYVDSDTTSKNALLGLGIGGSLRKDFTDKIFFGVEINYVKTNASDFDNFRAIGKLGYRLGK